MDKEFIRLKEALILTLAEEQKIQDAKDRIGIVKAELLEKILPYIKTDVYSGDCFRLSKGYTLEYDIEDPELKDYLKEKNTAVDVPLLKRAIKAGVQFTNVKAIPNLTVFKKANELRQIQGLSEDIS